MQNPFTLTFGRSPLESVDRPVQINEIIETFTADTINQLMFIITGVRGSGKTVMMTEISHKLRKNEKSLTFLYRVPKIQLKRYPFAFQVLGYLTWNNNGDYNGVLGDYEQYMR
uniref:hypothetical protein n=1 Tax=Agathobacter sp. TaxID=2021311 RepID=UPI003FEEA32B